MKGITKAKGLRHLGTATTRHIRAKPLQGGTAWLDMYPLVMERRRLEQEMAHLNERLTSIRQRLAKVREKIARLNARLSEVAQLEEAEGVAESASVESTSASPKPSPGPAPPEWKTMPLEY